MTAGRLLGSSPSEHAAGTDAVAGPGGDRAPRDDPNRRNRRDELRRWSASSNQRGAGAHPTRRSTAVSRRSSSTGTAPPFPTAAPTRAACASSSRNCARSGSTSPSSPARTSGTSTASCGPARAGPGRLYFCVNRGSEVFAVGPDGPELLDRREATREEDAALDAGRGGDGRGARRSRAHAEIVSSG